MADTDPALTLFASRLRAAMGERDVKVGELADYVGVTRQTVSGWRSAKHPPELRSAAAIEEYLDLEEGELIRLLAPPRGARDDVTREKRDPEELEAGHLQAAGRASYRNGIVASRETGRLLDLRAAEVVGANVRQGGEALESLLQGLLERSGVTLEKPRTRDAGYDAAWRDEAGTLCIAQVKVAGSGSAQVWAGMGELLAYQQLSGAGSERLFLVMNREPSQDEEAVLGHYGIALVWPDDWSGLGLDQENDQLAP